EKGTRRYREHTRTLDAELRASLTDLDASLARIVLANEPAILPRDFVEEIERLARRSLEDDLGGGRTLITPEEASILAIPRGSLTPDEVRQRSEEHTSELQSRFDLVCRLLLEKKKKTTHASMH